MRVSAANRGRGQPERIPQAEARDLKGGGPTVPKPPNPAKKVLEDYRQLLVQQETLEASIRRRYERATSCTTRVRPNKTTGGGASYDRMADDVCASVDAKAQLKETIRRIDREIGRVLRLTDLVTDEKQRTVLYMRYIDGMGFQQIADRLGYSRIHACRLNGLALLEINRKMGTLPDGRDGAGRKEG